ncbi:MAG: hypothetical protein ABIH82_05570 [Candidatus Woesearchaeota archaeon]
MMDFNEKRGVKRSKFNSIFFIILFISFISFMPSVFSIGLTGAKLGTIIYEPGKQIINDYVVSGTNLETEVSIGGELSEYVTINEVSHNRYKMIINFPEELIEPGTYSFTLTASEKPNEQEAGIGSFLSVSKRFEVKVYSFEKDLVASLSSPSVNINSTVEFKVGLESQSYSDIGSLQAVIRIYDSNSEEKGKVFTEQTNLLSLASKTLKASFDTTGLPAGNYKAKAEVFYDGNKKEIESEFKIGNLDLILRNYTTELTTGFSEFEAVVFNNWGNQLKNVYAIISINDKEELQTPSINLDGWQEGILKGIIKTDLLPGNYAGVIKLFYEGEHKEESANFIILEEVKPELIQAESELSKKNSIIWMMGMSVIVLVVVLLILVMSMVFKKKNGQL